MAGDLGAELGADGEDSLRVLPWRVDPVFGLALGRWRLSPLVVAFLFGVLTFLSDFLIAPAVGQTATGYFDPRNLQGRVDLLVDAVLVPAFGSLMVRFYYQVETAFERIFAGRMLKATSEEYAAFLIRLDRWYNGWVWHLVIAAIAVVLVLTGVIPWGIPLSYGHGPVNVARVVFQDVVGLVLWYSAIVFVAKAGITSVAFKAACRWPISVQPLHPDGCSGLRVMTEMGATVALFSAVVGTGVLVPVFESPKMARDWPFLVFGALVTLSPLLFLTCLRGAHRAMKKAKYDTLMRIHQEAQPYFEAVRGRLLRSEGVGDAADELMRLETLHGFVRRLPTWPVNTQELVQITLYVAIPLALVVLQLALNRK